MVEKQLELTQLQVNEAYIAIAKGLQFIFSNPTKYRRFFEESPEDKQKSWSELFQRKIGGSLDYGDKPEKAASIIDFDSDQKAAYVRLQLYYKGAKTESDFKYVKIPFDEKQKPTIQSGLIPSKATLYPPFIIARDEVILEAKKLELLETQDKINTMARGANKLPSQNVREYETIELLLSNRFRSENITVYLESQ